MFNTMKLPENVKAYFQRQGRIGAAKRKESLTPERRSEIARIAATTRWANQKNKTEEKASQEKKGTK
jgi:hypothetical protein